MRNLHTKILNIHFKVDLVNFSYVVVDYHVSIVKNGRGEGAHVKSLFFNEFKSQANRLGFKLFSEFLKLCSTTYIFGE